MAKLQVQSFAKLPNEYVSIERSRSLSLLEEKLVYMLINTMQKRFESTKKLDKIDYDFIASGSLNFDDFTDTMQIGAKDNKLIYQSLKDLFDYSLAVHQTNETRFIHLFGDMIIIHDSKEIKYKFGEVFIQYFTGICRDYFSLEVQEVIGLNSSYAIRIYQLLKSKLHMDKKEHNYKIEELKKLLNIEKKYERYNNFKQFVLDIAKQQINASEASKFSIEYKEEKTGKAVTSITFEILPKVKNYYVESNKIPVYKMDQLKKQCAEWLKHKNSVVRITAEKLQAELKMKKPLRATILYYIEVITSITEQKDFEDFLTPNTSQGFNPTTKPLVSTVEKPKRKPEQDDDHTPPPVHPEQQELPLKETTGQKILGGVANAGRKVGIRASQEMKKALEEREDNSIKEITKAVLDGLTNTNKERLRQSVERVGNLVETSKTFLKFITKDEFFTFVDNETRKGKDEHTAILELKKTYRY